MKTEYVIHNDEQGIFIGAALGMGFWSKLDTVGQPVACTFESEEQAKEFVSAWVEHNDPARYTYTAVAIANEGYATMQEMEDAGLGPLVEPMRVRVDQDIRTIPGNETIH